ncbi:MAG: 50S ribosomal protein L21 [Myxococcota bacterium]|jgi:large subunit ribosomal protein L21|nr:50S ribosomal protein L21 [Deltaproteobacteria bacterium]MCP4243447.1 50S ribosomal protein L21 [bacterium]MDP6076288.1 50S ribosomal protein L21 [Myxococcota bacterium]MDP6243258.1 50S ribosomal protein L21 [Myxococcota bacterium]MDP7074868.1 50S ribosomal protein L21 [Myxococcota bacterium]
MYAVIRSGGKQARVAPGDLLRVEKLDGAVGDSIELAEVLLVAGDQEPRVGTPLVDGARVRGTITAQGRGDKIIVFKMKRRKGYRRKAGHRQAYTEVRIDAIEG